MKRGVLAIPAVLAMAAGLAGALLYTWVLDPVEYYDSSPDALYIDAKLVYLLLIGDIYANTGDLAQAKAWLSELDVAADGQVLAGFVERYLDSGGQPEEVRNLARLAADLGAHGGVLLVFDTLPAPANTAATAPAVQAVASATSQPATPTPEPGFRLVEQTSLCADPGRPGQIAVWVRDANGNPLPGIEIVVSWSQGQDRFFTGLRPGRGTGYADFEMKPGIEYEAALAEFRGDVAEGLTSDLAPGLCPTGTLALNWKLTFEEMP
jgi:hypothetical protein